MSNLSELREQVEELTNRVAILESALVKPLDKGGIQEFHSERHEVGEVRTPIGYKIPKKRR